MQAAVDAPTSRSSHETLRGSIPTRALRARPPLILVASDQDSATAGFERVLTGSGYTLFRAHTGRLAAAAARSAQPDVVILDQALPDTAFEICRTLRDDPEVGPSTPLLMTTSEPPPRPRR